jgi:predicted DNA-binding transcriptional regulator YafY
MAGARSRVRDTRVVDRGLLRRAVWTLARLRAGAPVKATLLAREFEISVRTAYRDLDFLRDEWRVPLEFDRRRGTFYLSEPATLVAPISLSRGEVVSIFFAEKVLRQYRGTPFEADLASAFRKLQQLMPEEVSVVPETLDAVLSLDSGPTYTADGGVFADLLHALRQRRCAVIRYRSLSSDRTVDRRVRPYHLFNYRGDWYLAAWDERRAAVRDFALHRIQRMTVTTDGYEIPSDFNPQAYLTSAFAIEKGGRPVSVVIRFSPWQARWIRERKWHATAQVEDLIDGACVLKLRVAGLGEVRRWIMQFGAEAEVLKPEALRAAVTAELEEAAARYRGSSSAARQKGRTP